MAGKEPEKTSRSDSYLLVVEDSHVQAEIIAMLLEEHGYKVKKAANGRIALATLRDELPILVVSDILMPEMDGFELTRQIRNDPVLAPVPVLLLTGLSDADDVLQALSCGADSLVTKPYNNEFLLRKISQLLTKKKPVETIQKPSVPFPFIYDGKEYTIAESRQKIIEFLLTTYELTMERNHALIRAQNELRDLNTRLEEREVERARLAVIEEYSEDAIIGKTLEGSITRWNAGAERIYGYSSEEMIGKSISLLVPPNQLDDTKLILERIRNGEKVIRYETLRRKKDGGLLNISLTASPIRDTQNHMIGVSTIAHDVTWRKLTEETLLASEIRYRRLFETAQDGILIVDAESGQIVEVNPLLIDMLGFSREQFLGKKLWEIGLFKDIVANKENFEELQRKESIRYENLPLQTADGRNIAVEFVSNVYEVDNKKVIQCNIRDITERKKIEEALTSTETRYRRLFETAQDGILIVDAESGQIVEVNPFLIDMLGFSREQFLGKKLWEIGLFKDIVANKDNFEELQRKEYIRYEDMPLETADWRKIAVEFISNVYTVHNKKVIQCNIRDITDRKKIEVALNATETRYRRLFETAQDGILILDAETGQIVEVNPFLITFLGFSREQFLGKKIWEIGLFKDIVANKDNFEELQRKESIRYENLPLQTADGRNIAVEFVSNVYEVDNKKVIQCNIRDITDRKKIEEALNATETRYRRLFETAQDGILIVDAESGQIVEVNPFLIDMLGFSREQFLGKKLWEIGLFKDIIANKDNFEELQRKKYIRYEDMPLETADRRKIAVEFISNVYTVNNKRVIQCNIRDSTQRKLAEEALRQKNEEMDRYFTNTLDLLGIADTDGHFRRLNKEWESALGYNSAELEGKQFLDFVHPDDMEASRGALAGLKEGKKVPQFTNRYRHKNGSYRWIEWRLFPAGNVFYASARDVTERKKMADLVEASLSEKEMLLKEIHHRVKNNMQIISSLLLLQSQSVKDEETKLLFRDSMSRIKSIALVHEQLYRSDNLSQIEYGEYLRKMFGPLFESYKSDTRRIAMVIDSDNVMVTIEKAVPCSLIVNEMMSNSLKHAFPGDRKGEIRIRFTLDEANGNYILDYSDNGIGLPEGFVPGKTGSLGTSLINGLTRQLKGTLAMVPGPGVHYVITFPSRELRGK